MLFPDVSPREPPPESALTETQPAGGGGPTAGAQPGAAGPVIVLEPQAWERPVFYGVILVVLVVAFITLNKGGS